MKATFRISVFVLVLFSLQRFAFAQDVATTKPDFLWQPFPGNFPAGVLVYEGRAQTNDGAPVRAWCADIDPKSVRLRAFISTGVAGKESSTSLAAGGGALLAVNGGYFDMQSKPARTFSVVRRDGVSAATNIARLSRPVGGGATFFPVMRSAMGWNDDGPLQFAWTWQDGDVLRRAPAPLLNAVGAPAPAPTPDQIAAWPRWDVAHALGGGPRLLENGQPHVTYDEEVFFGSGFRGDVPYPRTAVGQTADGHIVLFVTDGKNPLYSVGLTLPQLADEMRKLGCVDAMNLDGGGSSTFVSEGRALNTPSDGQERAVTSIFAIVPR